MNNYFSIAIGVFVSYLLSMPIWGTDSTLLGIPIDNRYASREAYRVSWKDIIIVLIIIFFVGAGIYHQTKQSELQNENNELFVDICRSHYENQNYGLAIETLRPHLAENAKAKLIYGYFLIQGEYSTRDIEKGMEYYKNAMDEGVENAESCLVVAAVKHLGNDHRKVDIIRHAYENGNSLAVSYIDDLILRGYYYDYSRCYIDESGSVVVVNPKMTDLQVTGAEELWDLPLETIIKILHRDAEKWSIEKKLYSHFSPEPEEYGPEFIRIRTSVILDDTDIDVYIEETLVSHSNYPGWLVEDVW